MFMLCMLMMSLHQLLMTLNIKILAQPFNIQVKYFYKISVRSAIAFTPRCVSLGKKN